MARVIVIASEDLAESCSKELEERGYTHLHAASTDQAVELFAQDEDIAIAVVDYDLPGEGLGRLIGQLRDTRPHTLIIGQSTTNRRLNFSAFGVWQSLQKPWSADDFIATVQDRPKDVVRSRVVMTADAKHKWLSSMESRLQGVAGSHVELQDRVTEVLTAQSEVRQQQAALQSGQEDLMSGVEERLSALDSKLSTLVQSIESLAVSGKAEQHVGAARLEALVTGRLGALESVSDELVQFLRENEIFDALSSQALKLICAMGEFRHFEAGEVLFEVGAPCSEFFVVYSGVVEIRRRESAEDAENAVAYCGVGEVLCGAGVLSFGNHRSAAVAPEGAEVFALDRELLVDVLHMFPHLAVQMYLVLADRMSSFEERRSFQSGRRRLEGCLEYFDLAAILQSLIFGEERTGLFRVFDVDGKVVAQVQFGGGSISAARVGHAKGREAINRLFQLELASHTFSYREHNDTDTQRLQVDTALQEASMANILLDAARVSDETRRSSAEVEQAGDDDDDDDELVRSYRHLTSTLDWPNDATRDIAERIWEASGKGAALDQLLSGHREDAGRVRSTLAEMLRLGCMTVDTTTNPGVDESSQPWLVQMGDDSEEF